MAVCELHLFLVAADARDGWLLTRRRNILPSPSGRGIEGEGSFGGVSSSLTPTGFAPLASLSPEGEGKTTYFIAGLKATRGSRLEG